MPLREAMGCSEYKVSLKTRDPSEVKRLFPDALARCEERFALARAQSQGAHVLGLKDMRTLAGRWVRAEQEAMEASGGFEEWLVSDSADGDGLDDASRPLSLREWLASDPEFGLDEHVDSAARKALKTAGVPWPTAKETKVQLRTCFREHLLNLSDLALSRLRGDWAAQASLPKDELLASEVARGQASSRPSGKKLSELFELYEADKITTDGNGRGVQRSIRACRSHTQQFIQLMGDLPMSEISREVVHQYRDKASMLPSKGKGIRSMSAKQQLAKGQQGQLPRIAATTMRNKLKSLSSVLSAGVRLGWLAENPIIAGGLAGRAARAANRSAGEKKTRSDYTKEEIKQIFSSPIFNGVTRASHS